MHKAKPLIRSFFSAAASALGLVVAIDAGHAEEQSAAGADASAPTVLTSQDALKAMRGMSGYYRSTPNGDVYLYPAMKLAPEMYGMYGTYRVTSEGILLRPGGADGIAMAESAMGGASGTFRITPSGQAFFYANKEQVQDGAGTSAKGLE